MRLIPVMIIALASASAFADKASEITEESTGKAVYSQTCIACHGANGKGTIPGVQNLAASDGPLAKSDEELINSITNGLQSPGSPMAMPPKGGNPALTVDDIKAVIDYLRSTFSD